MTGASLQPIERIELAERRRDVLAAQARERQGTRTDLIKKRADEHSVQMDKKLPPPPARAPQAPAAMPKPAPPPPVLHADAEALVDSIREKAREKKVEAGGDKKSETFRDAQIAFPKIGKTDSSPPPPPPARPTPPPPPPAPVHTAKVLATKASVSHGTMDMVLAVKRHGDAELLDKMRAGAIALDERAVGAVGCRRSPRGGPRR